MAIAARRHELASLLALDDAELADLPTQLVGPLLSQLRMTRIDGLTAVANRRGIDERLETEWRRARRHGRPLSVILLDVDDLKGINDAHGHAAGDEALRQVAFGLVALLRTTDLLGRSGGDEFVLICPEADQAAVAAVALKIRQGLVVPVSVGCATLRPEQSLQELLAEADRALYQVKSALHHTTSRAPTDDTAPTNGAGPPAAEARPSSTRSATPSDPELQAARAALQTKSDFLRLAAHELRGPLTVILGYLAMLKMGSGEQMAKAGIDAVEIMETKLQELARFADQMLDVARLEDGHLHLAPRELDLRVVVQNAVRDAVATGADHRLRVELPDTELLVRGSEHRLLTIVSNLLSNAIKYSPDGGPIECTVVAEPTRARVLVRDYGIGIDPAVADRLFTPFERLDRKAAEGISGTGLGLYLSRELARGHGGDLKAQSGSPRGTTFVLELPRAGVPPVAV
jgi:diguanylate cyclase (GGDEF)-like protein